MRRGTFVSCQERPDQPSPLADINRRLDALEEHYANLKGVTKEIDEIRAEVRTIQKHLGIDRKIAV
jgi:hypothetical protein